LTNFALLSALRQVSSYRDQWSLASAPRIDSNPQTNEYGTGYGMEFVVRSHPHAKPASAEDGSETARFMTPNI